MAFRSSASANANSGVVTATPAGVVAGDYLGWFVTIDDNGAPTEGGPTGWTAQLNEGLVLQEQSAINYYDKIAVGGDSFSSPSAATFIGVIAVAFSGRNTGGTLAAAKTFQTGTKDDTLLGTPVSAALTGGTAAQGDDLLYLCCGDKAHISNTWSWSTISGFTNQDTESDFSDHTQNFQYQANVSAGATGTLTSTVTTGAGSLQGFGGVVIAVAAGVATEYVGPIYAQGHSPMIGRRYV